MPDAIIGNGLTLAGIPAASGLVNAVTSAAGGFQLPLLALLQASGTGNPLATLRQSSPETGTVLPISSLQQPAQSSPTEAIQHVLAALPHAPSDKDFAALKPDKASKQTAHHRAGTHNGATTVASLAIATNFTPEQPLTGEAETTPPDKPLIKPLIKPAKAISSDSASAVSASPIAQIAPPNTPQTPTLATRVQATDPAAEPANAVNAPSLSTESLSRDDVAMQAHVQRPTDATERTISDFPEPKLPLAKELQNPQRDFGNSNPGNSSHDTTDRHNTSPAIPLPNAGDTAGQVTQESPITLTAAFSPLPTDTTTTALVTNTDPVAAGTMVTTLHPHEPAATAPVTHDEPLLNIDLKLPVDHERWNEALHSRVIWQVTENVQQAHVRLNPPELGPVGVNVEINDGQAKVHFQAQHPVVRETIEAALPRLKEMFSEAGLQLADANVSQWSSQQNPSQQDSHRFPPLLWDENNGEEPVLPSATTITRSSNSLVDAYI